MPINDTPDAPAGFPVKLWFIDKMYAGHRLYYRWARERPRTYLLNVRSILGYRTIESASAHLTPEAAVADYVKSKRGMIERLTERLGQMRADADAVEKLTQRAWTTKRRQPAENTSTDERNRLMPTSTLNRYTCEKCDGSIITQDLDEGTTPMMLGCRATDACDGTMMSGMYQGVTGQPDYVWRKPTKVEYMAADAAMCHHFNLGGLDIFPVDAMPPPGAGCIGEPCPYCAISSAVVPTCGTCGGTGTVTIAAADRKGRTD